MKERVSNLPRLMQCNASLFPPLSELPDVKPVSEAAGPSTEAHKRIAQAINGAYLPGPIPDDMAPEVVRLYAAARQAWKKRHGAFRIPKAELDLFFTEGGITLTGHPDVVSLDEAPTGVVLDWKGMASEPDAIEQIKGYAFLLSAKYQLSSCDGYLVLLESREDISWTWTRAELDDWWEGVKKTLTEWDGAYHPGEQCEWCPKLTACPGRHALIKSFSQGVIAVDQMNPDALVAMRGRAKSVAKFAQDFLEALKLHVKAQGGSLECEDGTVLRLRETKKDGLYALAAEPVVVEETELTHDEFLTCCTLGKGKLLKLVAATVKRGNKGRVTGHLMDSLREAGAVTQSVSHSLVVDRNKAAIPVEAKS